MGSDSFAFEYSIIAILGAGGALFFALCIFLLFLFFSWSLRRAIRSATLFGLLLAVTLAIPITLQILSKRTSTTSQAFSITIDKVEVVQRDESAVILSFLTSRPARVHIVYINSETKKTHLIKSELGDTLLSDHVVTIDAKSHSSKGEVYIFVNGQQIKENMPIQIP